MYTREIQENRQGLVENGLPVLGTWTQAFEEVDLLNVHRPFSFPLPGGLKDLRIKEWETFTFQDDKLYVKARLSNFKFFHDAALTIYDKETEEKQEFHKLIPGSSWRLPRSL